MTGDQAITEQQADALLLEVYGVDWYDADRDWWVDMIAALMDCGTVTAARAWLMDPSS